MASTLKGFWDSFVKARRDKRERLATYFDEISRCLDEAVVDLRGGGAAVKACGKLHVYAEKVPTTLKGVLEDDEVADLADRLREAFYLRGLPTPTEGELQALEGASGAFEALPDTLRAR